MLTIEYKKKDAIVLLNYVRKGENYFHLVHEDSPTWGPELSFKSTSIRSCNDMGN